jgi:beta-phosphoglucomutase-like phosphatase (HAD superfamily)
METMAQRYLSAAIKLGRPPNQCVVFAACPTSVTAAHNCTMKAVALLGTHKAFHLKNADLTCANMRDLSVYNIRLVERGGWGGGEVVTTCFGETGERERCKGECA